MARHLVHIGYPKAASTFLQLWFTGHPQLRYVPGGIAGFANVYELSRSLGDSPPMYYVTSDEGLSSPAASVDHATLAEPGGAGVPDLVPIKRTQASVCARLKDMLPESRILIVTRGFKGIIMSGYSQYVRSGGVMHLRDMCEFLGTCLDEDEYHFYDFDYFVGLYAGAFGEENVVVVPFELLRDDQAAFLAVLEERLGLRHHEVTLDRPNPSLSWAELYWYPTISKAVSGTISRVGRSRCGRAYGWYTSRATMNNRLRPVVKLLQAFLPDRQIASEDFPSRVLERCRGRARCLQKDELYAPYASEYLWDGG